MPEGRTLPVILVGNDQYNTIQITPPHMVQPPPHLLPMFYQHVQQDNNVAEVKIAAEAASQNDIEVRPAGQSSDRSSSGLR